jgi:hypothetical protein
MSANLDIRRFGTPEEELALLGAARIACSQELQSLLISAAAPQHVLVCLNRIDQINSQAIKVAKSASDSANFRSLSMM